MVIGNWYEEIKTESFPLKAIVKPEGNTVCMLFCGEYRTGYASFDVSGFEYDKYIDTELFISKGRADVDIYAQWMKNGVEIYKEYISASSRIKPYGDADKLVISTLMRCEDECEASVEIISITQSEKMLAKKAKVASLAIDYGENHEARRVEDNLRDSLNGIDTLEKSAKPDLIVLTETFNSRNTGEKYMDACIRLDGDEIKAIRNKASEHKIYISLSMRETDDKGGIYNSAILIDRKGEIVSYYRKTHLTMNEKMKGIKPGKEPVVTDTDFGRVGFAICWDLYYPEYVKTLARMGAEIIINPTAGYNEKMHTLRAMDSGVYIVTAGTWKHSTVVISPEGEVIADGTKSGAAVAEIDLNQRYPVKYLSCGSYAERRNVYFNESREDLYIK